MGFIHFGLRMEIEELYLKWCEEEGVANEPNSFVAFMMLKGWLNEEKIIEDLDRKTENSSEIPNNCEDAENPSGDVWECGCFPDTYCEHQIYDRNPDGTINIVECGYEPKDEPFDKNTNVRSKDEPQTERSE